MTLPVALTIAGSDSGGGAGIVADLKTFEAMDIWGTVALAGVTAQNTAGVQAIELLSSQMVAAQIESVATDIRVDAVKTGMLGSAELITAVAAAVRRFLPVPLVVDPVLVATSGDALTETGAVGSIVRDLLPLAAVVTPNLAEASALTGRRIATRDDMESAGRDLVEKGAAAALVKGGHLGGDESPDCLVVRGGEVRWLEGARLSGGATHGTGCVLSAAICAGLAKGMDTPDACVAAKRFAERAIAAGPKLGSGARPANPGWERLTQP